MDVGVLAATVIGVLWLVAAWLLLRAGRRRTTGATRWLRDEATVCHRDGSTDGVLTSRPYLRYAGPDGRQRIRPSGSRGGMWSPGSTVPVRIDPQHPDRVMLHSAATRGVVYVVLGWFLVVVAVLTLASAAMLQWFVPR